MEGINFKNTFTYQLIIIKNSTLCFLLYIDDLIKEKGFAISANPILFNVQRINNAIGLYSH